MHLKSMIKEHKPAFLAILEPGIKIYKFAKRVRFNNYLQCNPTNTHIWLFWTSTWTLSQLQISDQVLNVKIQVVTTAAEKAGRGGIGHYAVSESDFKNFILQAGLMDPGYNGNIFAWGNNHEGSSRTWCRLDRVLINTAFLASFPAIQISHLARTYSDHAPLLISTQVPAPSFK